MKSMFAPTVLWVRSFSTGEQSRWISKGKQWLISSSDAYVVTGTKSMSYLSHHGVGRENVYTVGNPVDNDLFNRNVECNKRNGLPFDPTDNHVNILYVGNLSKRKGVDILMLAYSMAKSQDVRLIIVGDGPMAGMVEEKAKGDDSIYCMGNLERQKMIHIYNVSDILVLPSRYDLWGVVINEAMNCGNAIIASENVGAAGDLVQHGCNGLVFKNEQVTDLAMCIDRLCDQENRLRKMGNKSVDIISEWGFGRATRGFESAAESAIK
jgi:glycosyltransferase involved in cell wall biosynthesis